MNRKKYELKEGERIRVMDSKPIRNREKTIAKTYVKRKEQGVIVSRKENLDHKCIRAFEISLNILKNNLIAYEDEIIHILDTIPYSHLKNQHGIINFYRDRDGIKRCPECGKEIGEYVPKKYCCDQHRKLAVERAYFRRRRMEDKDRREYVKEFARKWREKKKEEGLCSRCGKNRPIDGYLCCWECRRDAQIYS